MLDQNIRVRPPNKSVLEWKYNIFRGFLFALFLSIPTSIITIVFVDLDGVSTLWTRPYSYISVVFFGMFLLGIHWARTVPPIYKFWYTEVVGVGEIVEHVVNPTGLMSYEFIIVVRGQNRAGETIMDDIVLDYDTWKGTRVGTFCKRLD